MCGGRKKSQADSEVLGRSKGGFSCKIHALADALGYPLTFILTPGQCSDIGQAENLAHNVSVKTLKGYDSKAFIESLNQRGIQAVIPSRSNALEPRSCDGVAYKERHLIEGFFGKIKHYRRVFSRFEKKAINFMGFLHFVVTLIWMR